MGLCGSPSPVPACPMARRDTDRGAPRGPPSAPRPAPRPGTSASPLARAIRSDRQGSPWVYLGRIGVRTRPCVAASRCATSKCGSKASRFARRIEQLYRPRSSSARLSRLNTALPRQRQPSGAERRAAREDSHATRSHIADTLAVATFRWSPVSSGTCAGRRGVLYGHPGGGSATADAPGKAWSIRRCSRSGSRAASARMRHDWMARCAQCRTSVGWRCLETLGTASALMPAEQGGAQGTGEQCANCGEYAVGGCSWRWEEDSRPTRRGKGAK